jgi:outer membrane protein, heavy metal efflux system
MRLRSDLAGESLPNWEPRGSSRRAAWIAISIWLVAIVWGLRLASGQPPQDFLLDQQQLDRTGSGLGQLVSWAVDQHPVIRAAQADLQRERGLRFQNTRAPNPSIGYVGSEIGNEGAGGQQGIFLSRQWITAGKRELADAIGRWQILAASQRLQLAQLRVTATTQRMYWNLVTARHRVELLGQLEQLLAEGLRINEALREASEVGLGAVLQAQLELQQVQLAGEQARVELQGQTDSLAAWLEVEPTWIEQVPSDPWPAPLNPDSLRQEQPWLQSPHLAEARAIIEAARHNLLLAQSQVRSNIDSFASLQHDAMTGDVITGIQVGAAVPLRDRKQGLIQAAQAEAMRAEAEYDRIRRQLASRWARTVASYRSAEILVNRIDQQLLDLARRRLDLAQQAYQQGELDYLELLTAQRSFLAIQQNLLDARQQKVLAAVELESLLVDTET